MLPIVKEKQAVKLRAFVELSFDTPKRSYQYTGVESSRNLPESVSSCSFSQLVVLRRTVFQHSPVGP